MTIDGIIQEMERRVLNDEPISPNSWIESALRVCILATNIDNDLAKIEADLIKREATFLAASMPSSKAKVLARADIDYEAYLKLKAKAHRIQEWIMLAKKRAIIEEV